MSTQTTTTKKLSKVQRAAIAAKARGYQYMYSVVKQVYNTTYYNVIDIDRVIERGWERAARGYITLKGGRNTIWHVIGTSTLPEQSINRSVAMSELAE